MIFMLMKNPKNGFHVTQRQHDDSLSLRWLLH